MNVADLLRRPGSTRAVHLEVPVPGSRSRHHGRRRPAPHDRPAPRQPFGCHRRLGSCAGPLARRLQPVPHAARGRLRPDAAGGFEGTRSRTRRIRSARRDRPRAAAAGPWSCPNSRSCRSAKRIAEGLCPSCGANLNEDRCDCGDRAERSPMGARSAGLCPHRRCRAPPRPHELTGAEEPDGRPQEEDEQGQDPERRASAWRASPPARSLCPHCHQTKLPDVSAQLRMVRRAPGRRGRVTQRDPGGTWR